MEIRVITKELQNEALELVWKVFLEYEAPDYSEQGIKAFRQSVIENEEYLNCIVLYGAYDKEQLKGVIATRNEGSHIALFFVDGKYHKKGIGRSLLNEVVRKCQSDEITVHSSPYAVEVYRHLGFVETDVEQVEEGIRYTPMKLAKIHFRRG